jgi:hypothetical protein
MAQWVFGYGAHAGAMWSDLGPVYPACPDAQVLEVQGVAGVTDSDNSVHGSFFGRLVKRSNTQCPAMVFRLALGHARGRKRPFPSDRQR